MNRDAITVTVVGKKKPKINIYKMYVLLIFVECQSGAHDRPEISGTYLPHPNNGGKESAKEYNQITHIIFAAVLNEDTFSEIFPRLALLVDGIIIISCGGCRFSTFFCTEG